MKDNMNHCQHSLSNNTVYKEVAVIGNGPSGLVTSFMLAGNVPYLRNIPENLSIDDMLKARLSNLPEEQSLYEADLIELAQGLEGRSKNPIPLLMDTLLRPCADMGMQGEPLIEWKHEKEKMIDHIVLGRGPPGGSWHSFTPSIKCLSPGAWLTLPPHHSADAQRLSAKAVASYFRKYVTKCKLQKYIRSGVTVNRVTPIPRLGEPCPNSNCPLNARFSISGYDKSEGRPFRYVCRSVVIACGGSDRPNTLHSLSSVAATTHIAKPIGSNTHTVLVVGSGLSAADGVLTALNLGLRVIHLHGAPPDALATLSPQTHPDYAKVYKMMCDGPNGNYPNYTSFSQHAIAEVTPLSINTHSRKIPTSDIEDSAICLNRVKLLNYVTNEMTEIDVSQIAIYIGAKPNLFFLQTNFNLNCIDLKGEIKFKIDSKHASKRKMDDDHRQCFFKNHWHYLKTVLGQSIQSCRSRYSNTEINGNNNICIVPDYNKIKNRQCDCKNLVSKLDSGVVKTCFEKCSCDNVTYSDQIDNKMDRYTNGLGFGIDKNKPVDCKSNPIAIDKSTHEFLNAPKGLYALGPITSDNFIRFIPGGALAIVAHMQKERSLTQ